MRNDKKNMLAALCAAVLLAGHAQASVVVNGDQVTATGTHVTYTFSLADLGLFGPIGSVTIVGDELRFAPTNFSTNLGIKQESLLIEATFSAGYGNYEFTRFDLSENGAITGSGAFDADAVFKVADSYLPNTNFSTLSLDKTVTGNGTSWEIKGSVIPLSGWGNGGFFNSAKLELTSSLFALGGPLVTRSGVNISAQVAAIPEAETYAMMLAGLGLVAFMARRRKPVVV